MYPFNHERPHPYIYDATIIPGWVPPPPPHYMPAPPMTYGQFVNAFGSPFEYVKHLMNGDCLRAIEYYIFVEYELAVINYNPKVFTNYFIAKMHELAPYINVIDKNLPEMDKILYDVIEKRTEHTDYGEISAQQDQYLELIGKTSNNVSNTANEGLASNEEITQTAASGTANEASFETNAASSGNYEEESKNAQEITDKTIKALIDVDIMEHTDNDKTGNNTKTGHEDKVKTGNTSDTGGSLTTENVGTVVETNNNISAIDNQEQNFSRVDNSASGRFIPPENTHPEQITSTIADNTLNGVPISIGNPTGRGDYSVNVTTQNNPKTTQTTNDKDKDITENTDTDRTEVTSLNTIVDIDHDKVQNTDGITADMTDKVGLNDRSKQGGELSDSEKIGGKGTDKLDMSNSEILGADSKITNSDTTQNSLSDTDTTGEKTKDRELTSLRDKVTDIARRETPLITLIAEIYKNMELLQYFSTIRKGLNFLFREVEY